MEGLKSGKPGRPTRLTPEVERSVVDRLRAGAYFEVACQSSGISKQLGHKWLQKGRDAKALAGEHDGEVDDHSKPFVSFLDAVDTASANAEVSALATLRQGSLGWQAQAWFLERRFPQRWRRRDVVQLEAPERAQDATDNLGAIRRDLAEADWPTLRSEIEAWASDDDEPEASP